MNHDEIEELARMIRLFDQAYYEDSNPLVPDHVYDSMVSRLKHYTQGDHPLLHKVGGLPDLRFAPVKHARPMLSLANCFTDEELDAFYARTNTGESKYVVELKLDGVALSVIYEGGVLVRAVTRGDGEVGEDVTHNAMHIGFLPKYIDYPHRLEVRGEVVFFKQDFLEMNRRLEERGEKTFSNARNAASGSLRHMDSSVIKERPLSFMAYDLYHGKPGGSHWENLEWALELGFVLSQCRAITAELEAIKSLYRNFYEGRNGFLVDIDGVVIKLDDLQARENHIGTSREPGWAIAYKFPPSSRVTRLESVDWQVGITGTLTPVARLEPVEIGGVVIRNVTLHNKDEVKRLGIYEGCLVEVCRSGDVIPKVSSVVPDGRDRDVLPLPTHCPCCKSELSYSKARVAICCLNRRGCRDQAVARLVRFCSKAGMDIDGFGETTVGLLYDAGYLKDYADFYTLHGHRDELVKIDGFGEKLVDGLLESIERSKSKSPSDLIYSLGIEGVGRSMSRKLSKLVSRVSDLGTVDKDQLMVVDGVGEVLCSTIAETFTDQAFMEQVRLVESSLHFSREGSMTKPLSGQRWVVTGTFGNGGRRMIEKWLLSNGADIDPRVTKSTTALLYGQKPGSKLSHAKALGINTLSEVEFYEAHKEFLCDIAGL